MTKENFIETIKCINAEERRLNALLQEQQNQKRAAKIEYAEANREFRQGDRVTVIAGDRKEHGVITGIASIDDNGAFKYNIAAMKKDGTAHGGKKVWLWYGYTIVPYQPDLS